MIYGKSLTVTKFLVQISSVEAIHCQHISCTCVFFNQPVLECLLQMQRKERNVMMLETDTLPAKHPRATTTQRVKRKRRITIPGAPLLGYVYYIGTREHLLTTNKAKLGLLTKNLGSVVSQKKVVKVSPP